VQTRAPARARRVVEFCLSIPEDQFRRNGVGRWLIRRAFQDRLPAAILSNPRRGLQAADWLQRLIAAKSRIMEELDLMEGCETARYALNLPWLRQTAESLSDSWDAADDEYGKLQTSFSAGLMIGRFLRWMETGARCRNDRRCG
jgi:asparagine synthase (glutamine-hydrolysing)